VGELEIILDWRGLVVDSRVQFDQTYNHLTDSRFMVIVLREGEYCEPVER